MLNALIWRQGKTTIEEYKQNQEIQERQCLKYDDEEELILKCSILFQDSLSIPRDLLSPLNGNVYCDWKLHEYLSSIVHEIKATM
jgi:hypothetical protein